ncbi:unnamed protein product [Effrenium voratum]|nr:unnamed protein product [Effrenium voratum]
MGHISGGSMRVFCAYASICSRSPCQEKWRKLKDLCLDEERHGLFYGTAGACDEDPTLACTESTQDTASFARQANQTADVLDSKCLEAAVRIQPNIYRSVTNVPDSDLEFDEEEDEEQVRRWAQLESINKSRKKEGLGPLLKLPKPYEKEGRLRESLWSETELFSGHIFYGRWYSLIWGGGPKAKKEVEETLVHNTGVVRQLTVPIKSQKKFYTNRSTYYPLIKPMTPPLTHHVPMPDVKS